LLFIEGLKPAAAAAPLPPPPPAAGSSGDNGAALIKYGVNSYITPKVCPVPYNSRQVKQ